MAYIACEPFINKALWKQRSEQKKKLITYNPCRVSSYLARLLDQYVHKADYSLIWSYASCEPALGIYHSLRIRRSIPATDEPDQCFDKLW